jgi:hypothetical protein
VQVLDRRVLLRPKLNSGILLARHRLMMAALFVLSFAVYAGGLSAANGAQAAAPIVPYVYATVSSSVNYDIMLADGVNKDRRVARVKVDGVAFSNIIARLSSDAPASTRLTSRLANTSR